MASFRPNQRRAAEKRPRAFKTSARFLSAGYPPLQFHISSNTGLGVLWALRRDTAGALPYGQVVRAVRFAAEGLRSSANDTITVPFFP